MVEPHVTYLSLGGNIEPRTQYLQRALEALETSGHVVEVSQFVESEPWGYEDSRHYLNAVCKYETSLVPLELLDFLESIERSLGRVRKSSDGYRSRTIDIDILFYDDMIFHHSRLTIPHPRLHLRNFVLAPLASIAPGLTHPVFKRSISELLRESKDTAPIHTLGI